ncbi:Protein of unknown function [Pyronema omphalodes CBS 100304]|uniref:Uncharacterized protein n=1 Tax=Pyronema omphalodes (strain CBS 100304) TaxID=1076935 RepID=U4LDS4_PYROM|nr:Protein of unknown function [Pyronema omphalodes CBS 100304]
MRQDRSRWTLANLRIALNTLLVSRNVPFQTRPTHRFGASSEQHRNIPRPQERSLFRPLNTSAFGTGTSTIDNLGFLGTFRDSTENSECFEDIEYLLFSAARARTQNSLKLLLLARLPVFSKHGDTDFKVRQPASLLSFSTHPIPKSQHRSTL